MTIMKCSSMPERICTTIAFYLIIFALLCQGFEGSSVVKLMEIDKVEHNCPEMDYCSYRNRTGISSPTITKSCACDVECNNFGDCCIDALRPNGLKSAMKCRIYKRSGAAYMIDNCPTAYNGSETWKELCERSAKFGRHIEYDPMIDVPVTDSHTSVTYKNIYCGLCNGKPVDMSFWKIRLYYPDLPYISELYNITEDYVLQNFVKSGMGSGIALSVAGVYFSCYMEAEIPSDLESKVRRCETSLISDCHEIWRNEITRKKCKSFLGPRVSDKGKGYRNIYCAKCNFENASDLKCGLPPKQIWEDLALLTDDPSFLIDVSVKQGDGMVRLCKSGDPNVEKCREFQRLSGFVKSGCKFFLRQ